ncbi:dynamin family [Brachionus plicatilis]|uniref:Dynamin family n=1 Tax=Brachionus plicatilis TaxID=10195 RepID=A0A3M7QPS2_BRAPC|nr:dynamin family [Brachionus plicatilis]
MSDLNSLEKSLVLLEQALSASKQLLDKSFPQNSDIDLRKKYTEIKIDLDDQLKRIRKKDFEMAAVGKEKSGKSSLLNAWIGFDLLPTDDKRCTYTTTEIRSCSTRNDQKYSIEYFTKDEFNELNSQDLESLASKGYGSLLHKERKEIEALKGQIDSYLGRPKVTQNFYSFDQVIYELRSAIADPGHARAVRKICIWTPLLSKHENVVLYDVPGYDSPLTLHKEQTKHKIAHVDSILFASPFRYPSLNDCEIEILELSDKSDYFIDIKDKIVVALTNCDAASSRSQFNKLLHENREAWKLKLVPENRIVPVCSIVEKANLDQPELIKAMNNLKELNGGDSGMSTLKQTVNECINGLKYKISSQRYLEIKSKLNKFFILLKERVKQKFNVDENTKLNELDDDCDAKKKCIEWWAQQWKSIHKNFQKFFYSKIKPNASPDDPSYLNEDDVQFKEIYTQEIDDAFQNLIIHDTEALKLIYNSVVHSKIMAPKYGNIEIRKEFAGEAMLCIGKLTQSLNNFSWRLIEKMIAWMQEEMWNIPEIRTEMIGKNENMTSSLIQCSFDALIKRLARPATDIFLRFPRSRVERLKVIKEFQMELVVMDNFMIDGRLSNRGLYQFLANGKHAKFVFELNHDQVYHTSENSPNDVFDSRSLVKANSIDNLSQENEAGKKKKRTNFLKKRKEKSQANEDTMSIASNSSNTFYLEDLSKTNNPFERLVFSPDAENFEQVRREIKEDFGEFLECLKNSIFYGSGIQRYYNSELENMRRKFIDLEVNSGTWYFYIDKYVNKPNSMIKIPVPVSADESNGKAFMIKTLQEMNKFINVVDNHSTADATSF